MEKLLEVKDLKVSFFTDLGETQAVKDAGFAIEEGDFFRNCRRIWKRKKCNNEIHSPSWPVQLQDYGRRNPVSGGGYSEKK